MNWNDAATFLEDIAKQSKDEQLDHGQRAAVLAIADRIVLGGVEQKIKVAHFRLCHSRKPFVVAYPGESQEMVLDAFTRALAFYGGVPRRVIIDRRGLENGVGHCFPDEA